MFIRNRNRLESQDDCDFKKSSESKPTYFLRIGSNEKEPRTEEKTIKELGFFFNYASFPFVNVAIDKERLEDRLLVVMHHKEADKESPPNRRITKKKGFERKLLTNFSSLFLRTIPIRYVLNFVKFR